MFKYEHRSTGIIEENYREDLTYYNWSERDEKFRAKQKDNQYVSLNKHFILISHKRKQDIILYTSTLLWFHKQPFVDVL